MKGQVQLHLVCDEEVGGTCGSAAVAGAIRNGELPRPKGIISGELSYLQVRTAERGIFRFKIRFKGRSAHTARARAEGLNAIAVASRGVLALEKHIDGCVSCKAEVEAFSVLFSGYLSNQSQSIAARIDQYIYVHIY